MKLNSVGVMKKTFLKKGGNILLHCGLLNYIYQKFPCCMKFTKKSVILDFFSSLWFVLSPVSHLLKRRWNLSLKIFEYESKCHYFASIWLVQLIAYHLYSSNIEKQCNDIEINPGPFSKTYITRAVTGNFHQADERFSVDSRGKQCVPNSAVSLLYSQIVNPGFWESSDLDKILIEGDSLYNLITFNFTQKGYLYASQIPVFIQKFNKNFKIEPTLISTAYLGEAVNTPEPCVHYKDALNKIIVNTGAIIIIGSNAFAVQYENQKIHVFDSHSRNKQGYPVADGKSVLITFSHLSDLYNYVSNYAQIFLQNTFEITYLKITNSASESRSTLQSSTSERPREVKLADAAQYEKSLQNYFLDQEEKNRNKQTAKLSQQYHTCTLESTRMHGRNVKNTRKVAERLCSSNLRKRKSMEEIPNIMKETMNVFDLTRPRKNK